ncbi:hypothetical protein DTL70_09445 [Streptomyces diacarni]|uniref:Uncharacterized protein n=1 Tax=Streptomyces diacarni TaxID=2800381 RepID=A0A367F5P0_9ACTN|nr:peptide MFS transporter [Streptomyces diacarni]RCG25591.1 hypothetical protein DTL70_09445 [Streptomyces diacarni]
MGPPSARSAAVARGPAPLFAVLWVRWGPRAPSAPVEFGCGLVLAGLSHVLLVLPAMQPGKSDPLWLLGSFAFSPSANCCSPPSVCR